MGHRTGEDSGGVGSGVAVIVAAGIALGLGQNYLAKESGPGRGLEWVKKEVVLEDLEAYHDADSTPANGAAAELESQPPATASVPVVPPDMNDPMAIRGVPEGDALPAIPDRDFPFQMQLPAVKRYFDAGAAVIIDARPPEEYAEGHIPGAVNMSYDEAVTDPARLESFDAQGKPIIIYCGGGTCEVSKNLAFAMIQAGHKKLLVFMGGWPEWQGAGYPVATGPEPGGEAR